MVNVRLSGPCWQWKEAALAAIRGCLMIMSHYFGVVLSVGSNTWSVSYTHLTLPTNREV